MILLDHFVELLGETRGRTRCERAVLSDHDVTNVPRSRDAWSCPQPKQRSKMSTVTCRRCRDRIVVESESVGLFERGRAICRLFIHVNLRYLTHSSHPVYWQPLRLNGCRKRRGTYERTRLPRWWSKSYPASFFLRLRHPTCSKASSACSSVGLTFLGTMGSLAYGGDASGRGDHQIRNATLILLALPARLGDRHVYCADRATIGVEDCGRSRNVAEIELFLRMRVA